MTMLPKIVLTKKKTVSVFPGGVQKLSDSDYCQSSRTFLSDVLARQAEFDEFIFRNGVATFHRNVYQVGELFASSIVPPERKETPKDGVKRMQDAMKLYFCSLNADEKVHMQDNCQKLARLTRTVQYYYNGEENISEDKIRWVASNWKAVFSKSFVERLGQDHLLLYLTTVIAFCKHGECNDGILWRMKYILVKNYQKEFNDLNISVVASIWTEYGQYVDDKTIRELFAQWKVIVPKDVSAELWSAVSYIIWYDCADYKIVTDSLRANRNFPWSRLERMIPMDFTNYANVVRAMGNRSWYNFDKSTSVVANKKFDGLVHSAKELFISTNGQTDAVSEFHVRPSKNVCLMLKRDMDGLVGCYVLRKLKGQRTHEVGDLNAEMSAFINALPDLENAQLEYDSAGLPDYRAAVDLHSEDKPSAAEDQESGKDIHGQMESLAI